MSEKESFTLTTCFTCGFLINNKQHIFFLLVLTVYISWVKLHIYLTLVSLSIHITSHRKKHQSPHLFLAGAQLLENITYQQPVQTVSVFVYDCNSACAALRNTLQKKKIFKSILIKTVLILTDTVVKNANWNKQDILTNTPVCCLTQNQMKRSPLC